MNTVFLKILNMSLTASLLIPAAHRTMTVSALPTKTAAAITIPLPKMLSYAFCMKASPLNWYLSTRIIMKQSF